VCVCVCAYIYVLTYIHTCIRTCIHAACTRTYIQDIHAYIHTLALAQTVTPCVSLHTVTVFLESSKFYVTFQVQSF